MNKLTSLLGVISLICLVPLIAGCKTRKPVYAKDLMFPTVTAVNMKYHNKIKVQGYRFSHTIPDAKGKFAFQISPISAMSEITVAHPAIKTFMMKHLCPKYTNRDGRAYNYAAYSPASSKPSAPFAPMVRKSRKDAIVVGWCILSARR